MNSNETIKNFISRLDGFYARDDSEAAGRLLSQMRREAEENGDTGLLITVLNEQMGFFRKAGDRGNAFSCAEEALRLVTERGIREKVSGATVLLNCATVFTAFNLTEDSFPLFEEAIAVYERDLPSGDGRLAGLYNNYAEALAAGGRYDCALDLNEKALGILSAIPGSGGEQAVTLLNRADIIEGGTGPEAGLEQIEGCVLRAQELLENKNLAHDGGYAFICRKCAPVFDHYGYFAYAKELAERADGIYERA